MSITTIGRIIALPTTGGASSHTRADQPLEAGTVCILASNGTHLARENSVRTLYNHDGCVTVYRSLNVALDYESFAWNGLPGGGTLALFAGLHRLRSYGEQGVNLPRVAVRWRWEVTIPAVGVNAAFAIAVVTPGFDRPSLVFPYATTAIDSALAPIGAPIDAALDITVPLALPGRVPCNPRPSAASPAPLPTENGVTDTIGVWLGFGTSGGKVAEPAHVHGLTVFLEEP